MEIEGFGAIISGLTLAKELYDIDRFDIVKQQFFDELCWDGYYENMIGTMSSIFTGFFSSYGEDDETEIMVFEDDVISNYFVHAMEYGKLHKLSYDQNPFVDEAQAEVRRHLNVSNCVDWKLLAYTKTKRTARQSRLLVSIYQSCGCNAMEHVAYGLIQLYTWFADKCAEFKALEAAKNMTFKSAPHINVKLISREVKAA